MEMVERCKKTEIGHIGPFVTQFDDRDEWIAIDVGLHTECGGVLFSPISFFE